jgi:hypothetical protein
MDNRSAVQNLWRAARDRLARLNQVLADAEPDDDAVFHVRARGPERGDDAERRLAEARKARLRKSG